MLLPHIYKFFFLLGRYLVHLPYAIVVYYVVFEVAEDGKPNIVLRGDESPLDASSKTCSTAEHLEDVKADISLNIGEKRKRTDYRYHFYV